jgi:hypothetical protein
MRFITRRPQASNRHAGRLLGGSLAGVLISSLSPISCREPARPPASATHQTTAPAPPTAALMPVVPAGDAHPTNWPGVVAEVTALRRKGNTLTAQLRFSNQGAQPSGQINFMDWRDVYLLDEAGARKYQVLVDDHHEAIAGSIAFYIDSGQSVVTWMKFPAPPREVRDVTLRMPNMTPFEDLTIQDQ